jgi:hypothetical protein
VVFTVRIETMLPAAVTAFGAKLHVALAGRLEQTNVTVEVVGKPFTGVTVTVSVPLVPAVNVSEAGATPSVKPSTGAAGVVALAWLEAGEVPLALVASTT